MTRLLHPFERSGFGSAPYTFVGYVEKVHVAGDAVKAGGTCDHCGTGIRHCFKIRSADGKEFVVGSTCVTKTYREVDTTVPVDIRRAIADVERQKREAKAAAAWKAFSPRLEAARASLDANASLFADRKHPNDYFASQGKTYRDYVTFNLNAGGMAGKEWAVALIENATK